MSELRQWHVPTSKEESIQVLKDALWRLDNFSCHYSEKFYPEQLRVILSHLEDNKCDDQILSKKIRILD